MGSYTEKFESQKQLSEVENKKLYIDQINERIRKAKSNSKLKKLKSNNFFGDSNTIFKRKIDEIDDSENKLNEFVEEEVDMV